MPRTARRAISLVISRAVRTDADPSTSTTANAIWRATWGRASSTAPTAHTAMESATSSRMERTIAVL